VRLHQRIILFLALLTATMAAGARADLVDEVFQRYIRPKAAAGPEALHLLYWRKADPEAAPVSCYRRYVPGEGWVAKEGFTGAHLCVTFFDGALYVFRKGNYSVYRGDKWEPQEWPLSWAPEAACRTGKALWVFGAASAEEKHRIHAARITPQSGHAAEPSLTAAEPLAIPAPASDLCAAAHGESAIVFWHQEPGPQRNDLWCASFDGKRWGEPQRVALPYQNSDYAVAEHEGTVWLFCKRRGKRMSAKRPLLMMRRTDAKWTGCSAVPHGTDPWFDWTIDLEAVSFRGTLYVFRACRGRVVAHRWRGGRWLAPETVAALPAWVAYGFWWLLGNVLATLALLPVVTLCAFRARGRSRSFVLPSGVQVSSATWPRRVAALLVDFLLTLLICVAVAPLVGLGGTAGAPEAQGFPATFALYLGIFFVYFVLSEGISGQSFGKQMLSIAVVGRDGRRPSLLSVVVRNLFRPWPVLVLAAYVVGSICILLTPRSQRLGDLVARTFVVDAVRAAPRPSRAHRA